MASTEAQRKWRAKNKDIKSQLNVMARKITHQGLDELAKTYRLKGKGEAVALCTFIAGELLEKGWRDPRTKLVLDSMVGNFKGRRKTLST